jgi:5'-nucleotidase
MHILLTNDDGVNAPGLLALKQALSPLGKVTVIAPSRNYSAAGHRKTLHKPLRLDEAQLADGSAAWVCSGAPSDCVALALLGFIKEKIDLVVSGVNPFPNLGQDLTYSGTVTAALEALIAGVPGVAVSTVSGTSANFENAARITVRIIQAFRGSDGLPKTVLNVNIPSGSKIKGLRITRLGQSVYRDVLVERLDPRSKPYYWIGGEIPTGVETEGTDFWALANGYVSITPLQLDLTDYKLMPKLEDVLGTKS